MYIGIAEKAMVSNTALAWLGNGDVRPRTNFLRAKFKNYLWNLTLPGGPQHPMPFPFPSHARAVLETIAFSAIPMYIFVTLL